MKPHKFSFNGPYRATLQISGTENVFLYEDGSIEIYMGDEGIEIPAPMVTMIMAFLEEHSDFIEDCAMQIMEYESEGKLEEEEDEGDWGTRPEDEYTEGYFYDAEETND